MTTGNQKTSAKKRSTKAGLLPGTLVHIGEPKLEKTVMRLIDYNEEACLEKEIDRIEEICATEEKPTIRWLAITGIHNTEVVEKIGERFNLHPLLLEDITNTEQRPKMEDYEDYLFFVLKMISYDNEKREVVTEQVSLVLGADYLLSFQEKEGNIFDNIRDRIKSNKGRIRKMGADYLAYSLIDIVIDNYFTAIERLGETIDALEEELVKNTGPQSLHLLHRLKKGMMILRKSLWPLREMISALERGESRLVQKTTYVYLRDIYDHTIQIIETVETFRDALSGMLDIYLSSISNKTNEIMKVLTMIATIFIPLTFIAGIYGMNFDFMPELGFKWAYPALLIMMGVIAIVMLAYFKKKRWL